MGTFHVTTVLNGPALSHQPNGKAEPLSQPDDITRLGPDLLVVFQNDVGPAGQAAPSGNLDSTIVQFTSSGKVLQQWDIAGHADGLTADPRRHMVIATVNEDGNSSLYTLDPAASPSNQLVHYDYNVNPLPHGGGTDAISIYRHHIFISASAPNPSPADVPALYLVHLHRASGALTGVARVTGVFSDEAPAKPANPGAPRTLTLTDPDSNEVVPNVAPRFRHDFVLDSQGDQQQIYVRNLATANQRLFDLKLSQSIDDTAWATSSSGVLYATDGSDNTVDAVRGPFRAGMPFVAVTPCDASTAPSTCPAPPTYPANYLGNLDMHTGAITAVSVNGVALQPKGLLFVGRKGAR